MVFDIYIENLPAIDPRQHTNNIKNNYCSCCFSKVVESKSALISSQRTNNLDDDLGSPMTEDLPLCF